MDDQMQNDLLEPTYDSSVLIRNVTLKICWKQWMIERGGERERERERERESGISFWMPDDDDDDDVNGM